MRKLLLLFFIYALPANANIVPNFVQGSMSSTTTTQTSISEQVTSKDYSTGYEYTVTVVTYWPVAVVPAPPAVIPIT